MAPHTKRAELNNESSSLGSVKTPGKGDLGLVSRWTPFDLCKYLESREGKIWQREDTLRVLERVEQIDNLIEQLIQAAGVEIIE